MTAPWFKLACMTALAVAPVAAQTKLTVRQGFPFVDVLVNGQGPFHMLLDTGASSSILSPKAAARAGVVPDQRSILVTFSGEKLVPESSRNSIQVGDIRQSGLPIVVMDVPRVRELDSRADGVLAQSFFERVPYLLDYKQKLLWLGSAATDEASRLPQSVEATRELHRTLLPVRFAPGGRVWQLQLDSGATNAVLNCSDQCPRAAEVSPPAKLLTHAGEQTVTVGRMRHVAVGEHTLAPVEAVLSDDNSRSDDGVVPARWFDAFYVSGDTVRFAAAR